MPSWPMMSFLTPFADAIRRAAQRAGLPADAVIEVGGMVLPNGSAAGIPNEVPAGR